MISEWLKSQIEMIIKQEDKTNGNCFIEDSQGNYIRIETQSLEGWMTLQLIVEMLAMENLFTDFQPNKITRDKVIFDVIVEHQWLVAGWAELHENGFLVFDAEDVPRKAFFSLQNSDKWELFGDALGYNSHESSSAFLVAQNLRVLDKLCFYDIPFDSSLTAEYRPISQPEILFNPLADGIRAFFTENSLNPLSKEEFDKFFYERDFSVFRDWNILGVDMETFGLNDIPSEVEIFQEEDALSALSTGFSDLENINVPLEVQVGPPQEEDALSGVSTEFNFNCSYDGDQSSSKKNNLGGLDLIDETPFDWFPHCRVEYFRPMSEFNSINDWLENFFDSTNGFNSLFKTFFYIYRYRLFFLLYWKLRFRWKQFKTRFE